MGKASQWCTDCQLFVRRLCRHRRRHHPDPLRAGGKKPAAEEWLDDAPQVEIGTPPASPAKALPAADSGGPSGVGSRTPPPLVIDTGSAARSAEPSESRPGTPPAPSAGKDHHLRRRNVRAPLFTPKRAPTDSPARSREPAPSVSNQTHDKATQADGCEYHIRRVRRQLVVGDPHLRAVPRRGLPRIRDEYSATEEEFARRVPKHHRRRMCDCAVCVGHGLLLADSQQPMAPPPTPGVDLVHLPGLKEKSATDEDRQRLRTFFVGNPEQTLVVCGCITCTLHRNLEKAWRQARRANPGGARMSRPAPK